METAADTSITCCICEEIYNLEERKPLLLPCSHSFCQSCLQQMKTGNNDLCPVCRSSWGGQSVDSLPFIRQLVETPEKTTTQTKDISAQSKSNCLTHNANFIFWCNTCDIPICSHCFIEEHKACDLIHLKDKTDGLLKNLRESVVTTRSKLIESFTQKTKKNNEILSDIQKTKKVLQQYENLVQTFAKKTFKQTQRSNESIRKIWKHSFRFKYTRFDCKYIKNLVTS